MSTKNLTQVQVAELAGLTDRGLRYLEAEGAGPMREPDGSYRPGAVAAWLRSRTDRRARSGDPADEGNPLRDLHNMTVNHFVWSLFTHGAQLLAGEVRDTAGTDKDTALAPFRGLLPYKLMPSVREGRAVVMLENLMACVSHHRIDGYERLARLLHPEVFK